MGNNLVNPQQSINHAQPAQSTSTKVTKQKTKRFRNNQHELLVFGYIRDLGLNTLISADLQHLCYQYYSSRQWIFGKGHAIFHMLDVATPQLLTNVIDFSSIKPEDRPFARTYCLIPHIPNKKVQSLFPDSDIHPKHSYVAILTEDQSIFYAHSGDSAVDWMTLYVFRSFDGVPRSSTMLKLRQKPLDNPNTLDFVRFHHLIYCGSHGVIGVYRNGVYQLKIDQIDEHLQFHMIRESDSESHDLQHYKMMYIEERDVLLACDMIKSRNQRNQKTSHCLRFNFTSKEWFTMFDRMPWSLDERIRLRWEPTQNFVVWNMCYDRNMDALYFVSNKYHVMRYDMKTAEFSVVMNSEVRDINPLCAIWMSQTSSDVICGLERGTMIFRRLDVGQVFRNTLTQSKTSAMSDVDETWQPYFHEFTPKIQDLRGLRIFQ